MLLLVCVRVTMCLISISQIYKEDVENEEQKKRRSKQTFVHHVVWGHLSFSFSLSKLYSAHFNAKDVPLPETYWSTQPEEHGKQNT